MKVETAFRPLSSVYGAVMTLRNRMYDEGYFAVGCTSIPVLSVGNITSGGNGKSPFVSMLVQALHKMGRRPVVLSRGYGGSIAGPRQVELGDTVSDVGDEAIMHHEVLGRIAPVVVSRRRISGAKMIELDALGDVIVLDDGFQHRALGRQLDIVLVDLSEKKKLEDWVRSTPLPAGRFREAKDAALRRADCVIHIVREGGDVDVAQGRTVLADCKKPVFSVVVRPVSWRDSYTGKRVALQEGEGLIGNAAAAIADPENFFSMLRRLGVELKKTTGFRDHHHFSSKNWDRLKPGINETLFVTAKDSVKLRRFVTQPMQMLVLEIGMEFVWPEEEREFFRLVERAIAEESVERLVGNL